VSLYDGPVQVDGAGSGQEPRNSKNHGDLVEKIMTTPSMMEFSSTRCNPATMDKYANVRPALKTALKNFFSARIDGIRGRGNKFIVWMWIALPGKRDIGSASPSSTIGAFLDAGKRQRKTQRRYSITTLNTSKKKMGNFKFILNAVLNDDCTASALRPGDIVGGNSTSGQACIFFGVAQSSPDVEGVLHLLLHDQETGQSYVVEGGVWMSDTSLVWSSDTETVDKLSKDEVLKYYLALDLDRTIISRQTSVATRLRSRSRKQPAPIVKQVTTPSRKSTRKQEPTPGADDTAKEIKKINKEQKKANAGMERANKALADTIRKRKNIDEQLNKEESRCKKVKDSLDGWRNEFEINRRARDNVRKQNARATRTLNQEKKKQSSSASSNDSGIGSGYGNSDAEGSSSMESTGGDTDSPSTTTPIPGTRRSKRISDRDDGSSENR